MDKKYNFTHAECFAFNNGTYQGFGVEWACENVGFGECTFLLDDDGSVTIESEHMCRGEDKNFVRQLMEYVIDHSVISN